jgi:hypothetical protein
VPNVFAPGKQVKLELGRAGFQRRLDHVSPSFLSCLATLFMLSSDELAHRSAPSFFGHRH